MHWKIKATLQNVIACLPHDLSHAAYYRMQRSVGSLRRVDPTSRLQAGIRTWRSIAEAGNDPRGKTFFEVGTGRALNAPLAFWLMGAESTFTVDLNRYLKPSLVHRSLQYIAANEQSSRSLFGDLLDEERFAQIIKFGNRKSFSIDELLAVTGIHYQAPSDAADTDLPDETVDFHTSYTVLEHIPAEILKKIFKEARRLLKPTGVMVHGVDYSDHFSHQDTAICAANFLRFSDRTWERWSGNRYMYMNRLRHHDYLRILRESGFEVSSAETVTDARSLSLLSSGDLLVDERFADLTAEQLAIISGWIVAAPFGINAKAEKTAA